MYSVVSDHLTGRALDWLKPRRLMGVLLISVVWVILYFPEEAASCIASTQPRLGLDNECLSYSLILLFVASLLMYVFCRFICRRHLAFALLAPVHDYQFREELKAAQARIPCGEGKSDLIEAQIAYIKAKIEGYVRELEHRALNCEFCVVVYFSSVTISTRVFLLGGVWHGIGLLLLMTFVALGFVLLRRAYSSCLDLAFGRWLPWELIMARLLLLPSDLRVWESTKFAGETE